MARIFARCKENFISTAIQRIRKHKGACGMGECHIFGEENNTLDCMILSNETPLLIQYIRMQGVQMKEALLFTYIFFIINKLGVKNKRKLRRINRR